MFSATAEELSLNEELSSAGTEPRQGRRRRTSLRTRRSSILSAIRRCIRRVPTTKRGFRWLTRSRAMATICSMLPLGNVYRAFRGFGTSVRHWRGQVVTQRPQPMQRSRFSTALDPFSAVRASV